LLAHLEDGLRSLNADVEHVDGIAGAKRADGLEDIPGVGQQGSGPADVGLDAPILRDALIDGKSVIWSGTPGSEGRLFCPEDWFLVPLTVLWGGGVLLGLPVAALGAYLAFGRFLFKAWRRKHSHYVITNKRVLIVVAGRVRAVPLKTMERCEVFGRSSNGLGNIRLGKLPPLARSHSDTGLDILSFLEGRPGAGAGSDPLVQGYDRTTDNV
jgi:hypothetical protein